MMFRALRLRWLGLWLAAGLGGLGAQPAPTAEDLAARTVILVNSRLPESVGLGRFYAEQRGIPAENLVALPMPEAETITWREFIEQVWQPLQDELHRRRWLEGSLSDRRDNLGRRRAALTGHRMAYLVICRGTPLRISHDPALEPPPPPGRRAPPSQFNTNQSAVDSELALLTQPNLPVVGFTRNPLYHRRETASVTEEMVVKTARLDGPTYADARRMVTSALTAERQGLIGRYYVDLGGPHAAGDRWLEATRAQLAGLGFFGDVHAGAGTFDIADRFDAPVLYFGWYSAQANGPFLRPHFRFPPGAVALHIHSFSATSLRTATDHWCGPLIARGVAATFGNVFEPYLEFSLRPDLLLLSLAAGGTLGDAAWYATPVLGWQGVILGDPLYRPFKVTLPEQMAQLETLPAELAGHVIARQAAVLDKLGLDGEAQALFARGQRDYPSLALALAFARYELLHERPAGAVAALRVFGAMREFPGTDWALGRAAAEMMAAHGTAREALPIYQTLARGAAPTVDARLKLLADARRVAETVGDLTLALEFSRLATELAPLGESMKGR